MLPSQTLRSPLPVVTAAVERLHSYDVAEGMAVDVSTIDPRRSAASEWEILPTLTGCCSKLTESIDDALMMH